MPGGEIIPSAQRGVIDCAEWVGGVEDLRLGFHNVWKYHYSPGVHETVTIGEVVFNLRRLEFAQAAGAGVDQVGGQRDLPDLVDQVAEAERRSPQGNAGEARRADPANAGRDPARVPQEAGTSSRPTSRRRTRSSRRSSTRRRPMRRWWCREAGLLPAVFVPRPTTTSPRRNRRRARQAGRLQAAPTRPSAGCSRPPARGPLRGDSRRAAHG